MHAARMMSTVVWLLALFCSLLLQPAISIPLENFYPYGNGTGDLALPQTTGDPPVTSPGYSLASPFPFYGANHSTLFVSSNGAIFLDHPALFYSNDPFPLAQPHPIIAPFWAVVSTENGRGRVWYRNATSNATLMMRARNEIRMASASNMTFQPTFLFVATWERVRYFGGTASNLTNTFQSVLVSDGRRSFAIFLYADGLIQWTTSTPFLEREFGTGGGGFGGPEAQLGFNAGDGVRGASLPGSRTAEVINIASTSNVGRRGVWLVRVDPEDIVIGRCGDTTGEISRLSSLRIAPRYGNQLGGTAIFLSGPCFDPTDDIECSFDDESYLVTGSYISNVLAVCVSPYIERRGWKTLIVTLWSQLEIHYSGEARFYAVSFEDSADITIEQLPVAGLATPTPPPTTLHFTPESSITLTWDRGSLVPMVDPSSIRVSIALSQLNLFTGRWERLQTLASDEANDGTAEVSLRSAGDASDSAIVDETRVIAFEVVVDSLPSSIGGAGAPPPLRNRESREAPSESPPIQIWSPVAFFTRNGGATLRGACEEWRRQQRVGIGDEILSRLPPCPRRLDQARAPNSGFREDVGVARLLSRRFFNRGAEFCFRQTTFTDSNMRSGQQCCYYGDGTLATNSPTGGTVDLVSPELSTTEHFIVDVLPFVECCDGVHSNCEVYYENRPSDDGSRYNPPPPACVYGDPHIVTLDGFKYTFNGRGEFTLIDTLDRQFTLQGRMDLPTGETIQEGIRATVFTAIVAQELSSDVVQIQLTPDGRSLEVLVNGTLVDFSDLAEQEFRNVAVSDHRNGTFWAVFSSGAYIEARQRNGFISTLLVSLSRSYWGRTAGLMGNYNGDTADDLTPPLGSGGGILLDSSLSDIHNLFGVTWIISRPEDSLFTYGQGTSFDTFFQPLFIPTFAPTFTDLELEARAMAMCGEDRFCLFDAAATGSTEIGLSTLQGGIEFDTIVNISVPAVCFPPCETGVCVSDGVCSCSPGFDGVRCSEPIFTACEEPGVCENGGSCRMRAGSFICSCPFGYSGIHCQIEANLDFGSGLLGSASGGDICECEREVECSISGSYDPQISGVLPTGPNLQCVINFGLDEDSEVLQVGSGGFGVSPFAIDNTFTVNFLSPGSLSFLTAIGAISRDDGITTCTLQETAQARGSLLEALGMEQITLIFQREEGQFDSISLNMNTVFLIFEQRDFTIGGRLSEAQSCSFQNLLNSLTRPPSSTSYTCRQGGVTSDLSTVISFMVICGLDQDI